MRRSMVKNIVGMSSLLIGTSLWMSACSDEEVSPALNEQVLISEIHLDVSPNLPLMINTDTLMSWSVLPEDASNKNVVWTSATPEVAEVSADGRITAKSLGTAIVTVYPEWGYASTASVTVRVIDHIDYIEDILLTNPADELSIYATASVQLQWATQPEDPTYPALTWESLTPDIATVSEAGVVRGLKAGTARIQATATDDRHYSKVFEVEVLPMIPIETLELDASHNELAKGEMTKIKVNVTPANATVSTLVWESSDPSVLSFDEDGVLTAHDYGTVVVSASADYGETSVYAEMNVTVAEGKVNDTFDNATPWEIFNGQGTVVGNVNGELVITPSPDKNYQGVRIRRTESIDFHAGNYPIFAVKVYMPADVFATSDKMEWYLDMWSTTEVYDCEGKFGENENKGNRAMEVKDCGDYKVYVADFSKKGLGTSGALMPTSQALNMDNIVFEWWKLWYEAGAPLDGTIRVDWIKTFKSEEELDALIASESAD